MDTGLVTFSSIAPEKDTSIPLHEIIAERRSAKSFLDLPVEPERLRSILEAARWAPSSRNEQPWRFIVETKLNPEGYQRLFSTLTDSNKAWAGQAPVLIAGVAKLFYERDKKPSRVALYDTGGAVANLTAQAVALGLQVHQMGGYNIAQVKELYKIPDGFEPAAVLAVGYADPATPLFSERVREELSALVFESEWGKSAQIVALHR